jgi:hypothetical protein
MHETYMKFIDTIMYPNTQKFQVPNTNSFSIFATNSQLFCAGHGGRAVQGSTVLEHSTTVTKASSPNGGVLCVCVLCCPV